jgi:hypothetical protein
MKKISIFVLAVLLLAPVSISATESNETEETIEALSSNGIGTWSAINNGLANTHVYVPAIDPLTPSIIYAGTDGGVFKSTNGGGIWSAINKGLTDTHVNLLVIDPLKPSTIYASTRDTGIVRSPDGGECGFMPLPAPVSLSRIMP